MNLKVLKLLVTLLTLSSFNINANSTAIEPVLVYLSNVEKNIDIHIGKYEVTVAEFTHFINATGYQLPAECNLYSSTSLPGEGKGIWNDAELIKNPYRPVVCIGTVGAMAYAKWLSKTTGKQYRLAEQNEWHYAASEGKQSRFSFGEDFEQTQICDYENVEDVAAIAGMKRDHNQRHYNSNASCNDGAVYHTVVGMYRPNKLGLHDMMGNVREFLQTCHKQDETHKPKCIEYKVAGEAWHWQARGVDSLDSMATGFIGSIEGFRLVLDSNETIKLSANTIAFSKRLLKAQKEARKAHQILKSLPNRPTGLTVRKLKNNKVELKWFALEGDNITYSVYRSYIDPHEKSTRKSQKIAEGLTKTNFIDQKVGSGAASYVVFANSTVGQSPPSLEALEGRHKIYTIGQQIQAEHYKDERFTWIRNKDKMQAVGFSSNDRHYPNGIIPFLPAWIKYNFKSDFSGKVNLRIRVSSQSDAQFEIWQGHHLIARIDAGNEKSFREIETTASLIEGDFPLEIRAINQQIFVVDWFEFKR